MAYISVIRMVSATPLNSKGTTTNDTAGSLCQTNNTPPVFK